MQFLTLLMVLFSSACSGLGPLPYLEPTLVETLPSAIAREQRAGVVTIVEFMDFGCPACRRQHAELTRALENYGERVRLVRRHRPLDADTAARGYACAESQGAAESMADALFTADSLDIRTVMSFATSIGLDPRSFQRCIMGRESSWKVERDVAASEDAYVERLPTLFINNERYEGVASEAQLKATFDRMLGAR